MTTVNTPCDAWQRSQADRDRIDTLLGGTEAMRAAGEKYMPRFEQESVADLNTRLARATLYPATSETLKNMVGRVFYRPIAREGVAAELKDALTDIDLLGNDLDVFSADWFYNGLAYGLCHVLVDFPSTEGLSSREDGVLTRAEVEAAGLRPYARLLKPHDLIGWIVEPVNGKNELTQIRIRETVAVRDGDFGMTLVTRIRVVERDSFTVYEERKEARSKKPTWTIIEQGRNPLGKIPLVTYYTGRTGTLTAKPPLNELAYLNIKHWQEQSDQDASVRFARVRMVWASGIDSETNLSASADSVIALPDNGKIGVVQGSAESVKVGAESLADLEAQMREAGAKLLIKSGQSTKTVTQAKSDAVVEQSALGAMAKGLEDAIDQMLQLLAEYISVEDGGHVDVNDTFDVLDDQASGADSLVKMSAAGIISEQTAFNEAKRRGILKADLSWETEQERIRAQA